MDYGLYNIDPPEFRIIERYIEDENITYYLKPAKDPLVCPVCGYSDFRRHGKFTRKARDLSEFTMKVGLVIHTHRYHCNNCGSTWVLSFSSIDPNAKMTNRMRDCIRKQSLSVPFSKISDELDVSVPTIKLQEGRARTACSG